MSVYSSSGLQYNQKVIAPGAQTERRGDAGPVRSLLRGKPHRPLLFFSLPTFDTFDHLDGVCDASAVVALLSGARSFHR
jgi:hypothetical protein